MNKKTEGCKCQSCGKHYQVDLIVPDDLWNSKIKPEDKPDGGGLLCGSCIMQRIEDVSSYDSYTLINTRSKI